MSGDYIGSERCHCYVLEVSAFISCIDALLFHDSQLLDVCMHVLVLLINR